VGTGTQFDYEELGTSHFAIEDEKIVKCLLNIDVYTPKTKEELSKLLKIKAVRPRYIRIGRFDKNNDCEISWRLETYPHEGGKLNYFKNKYGYKE
jgi:transketolase C-terminal domain/subunit